MRLLVIDDDPLVCTLARRIAEACGYEVRTTTEAEAFKTQCVEYLPDVISLDLSIPGCDGIELLRYLTDIGCRARILIASGFDAKVLRSANELGAARGLAMAGMISKPMRAAEVRAILESLRDDAPLPH
jgi:CheY-like chemotaxis protein